MTPDELFENNRGLAVHMAVKYAKKYPQIVLEDLTQECLEALHAASKSHDPKVPSTTHPGTFVPFGPYALRAITWACLHHWNKIRSAPKEIPLGAKIRSRDTESTVGDLLEAQAALGELQYDITQDRDDALIAGLHQIILQLENLTPGERRVLVALYITGVEAEVLEKKLKISYGTLRNIVLSAVRKLRSHFRKQGIPVVRGNLPIGTIKGTANTTVRPEKPQRLKNQKCVKAGKIGGKKRHGL
jgi:RNA polymerase sigma factor (sigma-70 family)